MGDISMRRRYRWINGEKGLVSLLLVVCLLPFYSFAAALEEGGRKMAASKAIYEAGSSSAYSTLSNYDAYLNDRFGLLAVSQGKNSSDSAEGMINKTFSEYLNKQKTIDTRAASLTGIAEGVYPLGDINVLEQEIEQTAKITVPEAMVKNGLDVDFFAKEIQKILGEKISVSAFLDSIANFCSLGENYIDIVVARDELKKLIEERLQKDNDAYREAYNRWKDAAAACGSIGNDPSADHTAEMQAAEEEKKNYIIQIEKMKEDISDLQDKANKLDNSKSDFKYGAGSFILDLGKDYAEYKKNEIAKNYKDDKTHVNDTYQGSVDKLNQEKKQGKIGQQDYSSALEKLQAEKKDKLEKLEQDKKEQERKYNVTSSAIKGSTSSMDDWQQQVKKSIEVFDSDLIEKTLSNLVQVESYVQKYPEGQAVDDSTCYIDLSSFTNENVVNQLNDHSEDGSIQEIWGLLSTLKSILQTLQSTTWLYDSDLRVTIDQAFYEKLPSRRPEDRESIKNAHEESDQRLSQKYHDMIKASPNETAPSVNRISKLQADIHRFLTDMDDIGQVGSADDIVTYADNFRKVIKNCKNIANDITNLAGSFKMSAGMTAVQNRLLLTGYYNYYLPCRTNYAKYSSKGGVTAPGNSESLTSLLDFGFIPDLADRYAVNSYSFSGAELEYMIGGKPEEIKNQESTFWDLYILRLVSTDLLSIFLNQSFMNTAAAFFDSAALAVVGVIYVVAVILAEPLLDCFILVNGGEEPMLFKKTIYLTPEGLPELITDLAKCPTKGEENIADFLRTQAESMEDKPSYHQGEGESAAVPRETVMNEYGEGFLKKDYQEHLLFYMLLFGSKKTYLKRFQDIITMEHTQYNHQEASSETRVTGSYPSFDIDCAYTMVRADVTGTVRPILPVPSSILPNQSPFSIHQIIYRGY